MSKIQIEMAATPPRSKADVLFVLDATSSMQCIFNAMVDKMEDLAYDFQIHWRRTDIRYGAIIYRDPVSYKQAPESELDEETKRDLERLLAQDKEKRKQTQIAAGTYDEDREKELEERQKFYNKTKYPFDKNVLIPFKDDYEQLKTELLQVQCGGGNDDPEDWVGAIDIALNNNLTQWTPKSKKVIVWITDANAHGRKFCGYDNYQEQESKLEPYFGEMARRGIHFVGLNIRKSVLVKTRNAAGEEVEEWKEDSGCRQTLDILHEHYMNQPNHKSFTIADFPRRYDPYLYPDDDLPPDLMDEFAQTLTSSMRSVA